VLSDYIPLLAFLGFSLVMAFILLVIHDLVLRREEKLAEKGIFKGKRGELPKAPKLPEINSPKPGAIDSFRALVYEAGTELTPFEGAQLVFIGGLLTGGLAFLWLHNLLVTAAGVLVGSLAVLVVFLICRWRRRQAVQRQLPMVTEFLARSVKAGESFDQAIIAAGATSPSPLGKEMRTCARQINMGLSLESALRRFVERTPLLETRMFSAALIVQRQAGGDLGELLSQMARVFRERVGFSRHFLALTFVSRMSVILILFFGILAAIIPITASPDYVKESLDTTLGQTFLIIAGVLYVLGLILSFFFLRSKY